MKTERDTLLSMLKDAVLPLNTAATAEGTNCDVTAAAGMMSSNSEVGITCTLCKMFSSK